MTYRDACDAGATKSVAVRTSANAALPTTIGTVEVTKKIEETSRLIACRVETERKLAAIASLTLTPSAELTPWLALASVSYGFGQDGRHGGGTSDLRLENGKIVVPGITAYCDGSEGIPNTVHEVTFNVRIDGATTQPKSIKFNVDLTCPGIQTPHTPDASVEVTDDEVSGPAAAIDRDDGCSVGGSSRNAWSTLLMGCAVALLRRRRVTRAR